MRPLLPVLLLAATVLAGCADEPAPAPVDPDDEKFGELDVTEDTGAIRGLVLDPTIVPIEGARIALIGESKETVSDAEGAFAFDALEPGTYFMEISKVGYESAQQSALVVAGEERPDIVKVRLVPDPESLPLVDTQSWTGYLQCGVGSPAGSLNPCFETGSENTHNFTVSGVPDYVQIEAAWKGTNVLGDSLSIGILDPNGLASNFAGADCASPCVFRVDRETLVANLGEDFTQYMVRVFPGSGEDNPASVVVEQEFTIYATEFHRIEPDEDWLFVEDGAYPVDN